jgi:hypothetical protein
MNQLRCRDLRAGDLFLKVSAGSFTNRMIQFGQNLVGQKNPEVVHAGVMFDSTYCVEASGGGLHASDMRVQNLPYGYYIYRCTNPNVAAGAGTCAKMMFDIHMQHGSVKYSMAGAVGSLFGSGGKPVEPSQMDALLDRILEGKNNPFFCSQFVVYVYQFVAEQCGIPAATLFNLQDAKVSPSKLASYLQGHPMFKEAGYMMPKER